MKRITTLLFLLLGLNFVQAQTFNAGLDLFEQGDYERALRIFEQSETPEAHLFAGKSNFALNNYLRAVLHLEQVPQTAPVDIYHEAVYTRALAKFQLKDYASSLDILKALSEASPASPSSRNAITLYDQVLGYLTMSQRLEVFNESSSDEVRFDVLDSALGRVSFAAAQTLFDIYKNSVGSFNDLQMSSIETALADSLTYRSRFSSTQRMTAPRGISYNLGVLLPEFDFDTPQYEIAQHLYFGIQLAIEEYNSQNHDQKVFITYRNTNQDSQNSDAVMTELVWKDQVDLILGPLFSETAREYAGHAKSYEVPMLLPLANADSLDLYNDYVFQLNPAFAQQGRAMARYAIHTLGYDTLGVIAEKGSLGAPAARAFLREAERLGGFVRYYFEEDLQQTGYDIIDYTHYFTTNELDSVDIVEAVYAPFTGAVAPTLIESMLTDLEAMRSDIHILGSEEWMNVDLESRRLPETELYYTETFAVDTSHNEIDQFDSSFRLRFNTSPTQFAYIGYDAASVVLEVIRAAKNPAYFRETLSNIRNFDGLSLDVDFGGSLVNKKIRIVKKDRGSDDDPFQPREERRRRR